MDKDGKVRLQLLGGYKEPLAEKVDISLRQQILTGRRVFNASMSKNHPTHPYDIHEILASHQNLDPGYRVIV
jgi:hypothetical protein